MIFKRNIKINFDNYIYAYILLFKIIIWFIILVSNILALYKCIGGIDARSKVWIMDQNCRKIMLSVSFAVQKLMRYKKTYIHMFRIPFSLDRVFDTKHFSRWKEISNFSIYAHKQLQIIAGKCNGSADV